MPECMQEADSSRPNKIPLFLVFFSFSRYRLAARIFIHSIIHEGMQPPRKPDAIAIYAQNIPPPSQTPSKPKKGEKNHTS